MNKQKIQASDEAWDARSLGNHEDFVEVVDETNEIKIDEASGTQLISIRLQKSLIDDFKLIASLNGNIGYQTLMKQIMQRFVECEKKRIFNELVSERLKEQQKHMEKEKPTEKQRKTA